MEDQSAKTPIKPSTEFFLSESKADVLKLVKSTTRLSSIDTLRGLVMVIMALDHVREFLHVDAMFYNATDLNTTYPALFFTRILTHICAPTFVFLAGLSAKLLGKQKGRSELSRFLVSRGLWLIFLDVTVINFASWFDPTFSLINLQVLWAIGWSMVVLSGLVWLPERIMVIIGLVLVVGHNLLDSVVVPVTSRWHFLWALVHERSLITVTPTFKIMILYPVLPWIGIMALGYYVGNWYDRSVAPVWRKKLLLRAGVVALAAFLLLRIVNVYGDPLAWRVESTGLWTLMSFLNVTKYPPSLLYTLLTLGLALLLLVALENRRMSWMSVFAVYGRVPLFYYVVHFYLIHSLSVLNLLLSGVSWTSIDFQNGTGGISPGDGVSLPMTYLIWLLLVVSLYPLCLWYQGFKSKQTGWHWQYL